MREETPILTKLEPALTKSIEEASIAIQYLSSSSDAAEFFEIPEGQLLFILYKLPDSRKYKKFQIKKKTGGHRIIKAPLGGIKILQNKLKPVLYELYKVKQCVHGFVPDKSIKTNAVQHKKRRYVLNIDLKHFYDSINFGRVRGLFMAKPFNMGAKAATVFAQLCTHDDALPQGAPTSPILSNYIAADLDKKLTLFAKKNALRYTRYADDISFSTSKKIFPKKVAHYKGENPLTAEILLGKSLKSKILASGFEINYNKVRLLTQGVRQEVTGLTVNEFPNVKRKYIRNIRGMIHAWRKYTLIGAEKEFFSKYASNSSVKISEEKLTGAFFKNVLYGRLAYLKMVRGQKDDLYIKLCLQVAELDKDAPLKIRNLKEMYEQFDIFISHASEDKSKIAEPIFEESKAAGINAFLDIKYIKWGDSLTEKINRALGQSKYVLAILSENSVEKTWPAKEINAALARELSGKQKILPLIVGKPDLSRVSLLEDKLYITWNDNPKEIVEKIRELLYA